MIVMTKEKEIWFKRMLILIASVVTPKKRFVQIKKAEDLLLRKENRSGKVPKQKK